MRRHLKMLILAVGCASMLPVATGAQTSESKTKVKAEHGKTVTYTGCVQTGTETRTYVLQNVLPVERTETTGTAGTMRRPPTRSSLNRPWSCNSRSAIRWKSRAC